MGNRISKETLFLRHNFTEDERLKMGDELASAYNRQADIDNEENVVKSQFKERRATIEQKISSLSRNLSNGFEMSNVECRLEWDSPNPFEVSYVRNDTNEVVRTRPMTEQERQMDLPLQEPATEAAVAESVAQSEAAVEEFFDKEPEPAAEKTEEPSPPQAAPAKGGKKKAAEEF
jgi:hypothetical protein